MAELSSLQIGRWQLRPASDELVLDGRAVKIEPRLTRLLVVLADANGQVVDQAALMARVWAPAVVTPSSIYEAVARLRSVLAADVSTPEYIASVPRRGYRLAVPVHGQVDDAWPKLAVLPFRAGPLPPALAPLRERLLEGLIGELARVAPCRVLARATGLSESFDAQALGVRFIVDGSIRCDGRSVVVQADLIDQRNGEMIASELVKAPLADGPVLALPLVERIARALNLRLPAALLAPGAPGFADARREAARAWRELFCRPQAAATNSAAWSAAENALALDADDELANVSMAYAAWRGGNFGWRPEGREQMYDLALRHAERAIERDPAQADAHFVRALVAFSHGNFAAADTGMRDAARLAPSHAPAFGLLARVRCVLGHPEETAALVEHAIAISPLEPLRAVWYWTETLSWLALGDHERALDRAQRALALNPNNPHCWFCAIASAQAAGEAALAARWRREFRERHPQLASLEGLARITPADSGAAHAAQMTHYRGLLAQAGLAGPG